MDEDGAHVLRELGDTREAIKQGTQALSQAPGDGDALHAVNASQQKADQISTAYEQGQVTDIAKVMLARQEASVGFEATLQVRNKLLSAYKDIMSMPV